uniref:Reverse transcriptase domain-containing protein n=1 Tax=Fagus sylvatica TaxID=28930 RepID=A0A2N9HZK5_FAGSY
MHHNKIGRDGAMALKLDMSKAYDRVEWSFLEKIMSQMGFHQKWISIMTECISTVSYSILVNGEPHGYIQPSRGLRQGDPLSPYLFLLCAEGLHSLIQKANMDGDIQGISLCRNGPKISHLFFADDSLLFSRATPNACEKIQGILAQYEKASGQQVNRDKTTIYFSKNTPEASQHIIKEALEVPIIRQYEKYLGLPSFVGRNRAASFTQIKERVWQKLKGWKEKLLSQAGREILIKAVAQAIPTYSMSCFKLPAKLCNELEAMVRRFWWSNNPEHRKIHWVAWRKLCQPKYKGGMGFRDIRKFNDALLAKQVWRLLHDTSSLFYRVFKAKFFPHGSILDCPTTTRGSYAWQSILKARDVILKGAVWRVGNGQSINIWDQRWLLESHHRKIITPSPTILRHCTVDQLIIKPQMTWDNSLIDSLFSPYDAEAIKQIPLSNHYHADKIIWPCNTNGEYTVRSGYRFLVDEEDKNLPGSSMPNPLQDIWKSIWSLKIPRKCQLFAWKASREVLPTKLNLQKRQIPVGTTCEICGEKDEDAIHALWSCKHLQSVWSNERRNKLRLNQEVDSINHVGLQAKSYLEEYMRENEPSNPKPQPALAVRWIPSRKHRYKVNYDGAVFKETNAAGIGVIVRDSSGLVMASLSQKVRFPHSVPSIEAWAVKRSIQFVLEIGLTDAKFEGDSQTIVAALNDPKPSLAPFGLLITDAKVLASKLQSFSFSHVKRQGNQLAHAFSPQSSFL